LEEINLSPEVIDSLLGRTVMASILPEEQPLTRRIDPDRVGDEPAVLLDPEGISWNDYLPARVQFTDSESRVWRLPRFWLDGVPDAPPSAPVTDEAIVSEEINLPTEWDLSDINVTSLAALRAASCRTHVVVSIALNGSVQVHWCDPEGVTWRLPGNWRRRLVKLPDREILMVQGVPEDVANDFGRQVVAVNYHPGSLCCLPDHYRFRDDRGGKWPVRIADCGVVGFGNSPREVPA